MTNTYNIPDVSQCSSDDDPGPPVYSPVSESSLSESLSEDPDDEVLTTNLPSIPSVTDGQDDENCATDIEWQFRFVMIGDNLDKTVKPRYIKLEYAHVNVQYSTRGNSEQ